MGTLIFHNGDTIYPNSEIEVAGSALTSVAAGISASAFEFIATSQPNLHEKGDSSF